ncbi:lycopene cyclase domain-containing protein [Microbacterium lacus]|uniref:lycopene cyclase domain-containing protein n=1 Tax=Microbacterium lacus TaxID=415217 RepID=UPI0038504C1C
MPGLYLIAILVSAAGIATIDARFKLAAWRSPWRAAVAVALGVVFFLLWDIVGIMTGVFLKGDSPLFTGIDVGPELPLEEVFFLAFLSYLSLVIWAAAMRVIERRASPPPPPAVGSDDVPASTEGQSR